MAARRAHFVCAILTRVTLAAFVALLPSSSIAIQLRWSTGATDLSVAQNTRATLVVLADSTEFALPGEWWLLWTADSSGVRFVAPESLFACQSDTAKVATIDPPQTPADSAANRITAHFCSDGEASASIAHWVVELVGGSRGQLKVMAPDPADSTSVIESNEVTFNGGVGGYFTTIQGVSPRLLAAGQQTTLRITGTNFGAATQVTLLNRGISLDATSVAERDPNTINATFSVPRSFIGSTSVVVGSDANRPDTLIDCLYVEQPDASAYKADEVLVWFRPGVTTLASGQTSAALNAVTFNPSSVSATLAAAGAVDLRMLTPSATRENLAGLHTGQLDTYVVALVDTNVIQAIATLSADTAHVICAEPNWMRRAQSAPPSDPLFAKQWWLNNTGQFFGGPGPGRDLDALRAWDFGPGLTPTTVVVLDTGVDIAHPEFGGRAIYGINEVDTTATADDDAPHSHGTSVAGIIAAGRDGLGVVGIDPTAGIVSVKVLDNRGNGTEAQINAGVDWARTHGYKIINLSLGGGEASIIEELIYKNAYMSGMAVFAATGNDWSEGNQYPAAYAPYVIAVGAFMNDGSHWHVFDSPWDSLGGLGPACQYYWYGGTNYGPEMHFLAPGGWFIETTRSVATGMYWDIRDTSQPDTISTACNNGFSGTSAASPAAAGTAALVQSIVRPIGTLLTGEDLDQILSRTTDPTSDPYSVGLFAGAGNINAGKAAAMVAGARAVEHGVAAATDSTRDANLALLFLDGWGNLTAGQHAARRYIMRKRIAFGHTFTDTPAVWARNVSSWGAGEDTVINHTRQKFGSLFLNGIYQWTYPPPWSPSADVEAVTRDSVTLRTYVYLVESTYWWPTQPESAFVAYTAIGPVATAGVDQGGFGASLRFAAAPNPAIGKARILFTLPAPGKVKLRIYDVAGRCVRELVSGLLPAGEKTYTWDVAEGSDRAIPAGVYFARLESPFGTRVSRFVILR